MRRHVKASSAGWTLRTSMLAGLLAVADAATFAFAASSASAASPATTISSTATAGYTTAQVSGTVDPADQEA